MYISNIIIVKAGGRKLIQYILSECELKRIYNDFPELSRGNGAQERANHATVASAATES